MSFWTPERVAAALGREGGGRHPGGTGPFTGISTDSRTIPPGSLFVALVGAAFDAHDFVQQALERGAAGLLLSRPVPVGTAGVPVFEVGDTLVALGQLATYWRRAWGRPVVLVAGSNGKTTTKDLIAAALSSAFEVHATTGNLNNRVGLPLTLLGIPPSAEIAVVEAGTNVLGEVATLRQIAEPDISVVVSIGEEHLEGLGSIEGILREETSSFDGVELAVAPAAQPEIAREARGKARRVVTAGLDEGDVRPDSWSIGPDGAGTLVFADVTMSPAVRGLHNLRNAMLAVAVGRACGVSDEAMALGIQAMTAPRMRAAWEQVGGVTIINDAYNANPGSTRAALEMVRLVGGARQRVAVLGTMRELGAETQRCHDEISRLALETGADVVAGIGEFAESLSRVAAGDDRVVTAADVEDLWPALEPRLRPNAVILLKASRGVRLERLLPQITTWARP